MPFFDDLAPHYDDALRYCRALCAGWGPDAAEDVLHDALLRAHRRHGQLRDPAAFRGWLFRVILRTHQNAHRGRFWRRFVPLPPPDRDGPEVYSRAEPSAESRALLRALAALPDRDRATLLLFEIGGFSTDEVAGLVGDKTASATKSRLSRTRRALRDALGDEAGPLGSAPGETLAEQTWTLTQTS